jgi:hypothetical protein
VRLLEALVFVLIAASVLAGEFLRRGERAALGRGLLGA